MNRLQLCSKETSLLAQELGYTWKTDYDYYFLLNNDNSDEFKLYSPSEIWHIEPKNKLICPQQHLLQKWLRDEHIVWISIKPEVIDFKAKTYGWVNNYVTFPSKIFETYEEALEDGLFRALNHLKENNGNKTE